MKFELMNVSLIHAIQPNLRTSKSLWQKSLSQGNHCQVLFDQGSSNFKFYRA